MQKLADICIRRPVFAAMIIMALVVVGAASYGQLGVDRFPSVDLPTVSVRTGLPGASTEEVETEVSQRIEETVNTVEGIQELRSVSSAGSSFVIVTFDLSRDIDTAAQDIRDRVSSVVRQLPDDALPPVIAKFNNDTAAVLTVALSGNRSLKELTEVADKIVKVQLERSAGVGEVQIIGGLERAVNVWVDPERLAAYQIPITDVRDALVRQNSDVPGGNVTDSAREMTLRTMGKLTAARDFDDLVVKTVNSQPVRIRDLGYAEDGTKEQRSVARLNGVPTVTLEVRRQSGANTVEVIEAAKQNLERVKAQIPGDLEMQVIRDQSRYIYAALHEINLHLILGSILASLVVFAFMRSWRTTLIAAIAIPTSVIATFGMMKALAFTLSLVVIFVPVSFMSSISGRFLFQFGLTAAAAVLVSLLVSFTLTPMMSARLLRAEDAASGHGEAKSRGGFYARLDRTYERMLRLTLRHRKQTAAACLLVMLSSIVLFKLVKVEYIPSDV